MGKKRDVHLQNNLEAGLALDLDGGDCGANKAGYRGARARVNIGDIDEMEIQGFELCPLRTLGFTILCAVTACFPLVLISWKTEIKMFFLYKPVQLVNAKKVLLKDRKFGQIFEETIIREKSQNSA